jgi:hypothetical protein
LLFQILNLYCYTKPSRRTSRGGWRSSSTGAQTRCWRAARRRQGVITCSHSSTCVSLISAVLLSLLSLKLTTIIAAIKPQVLRNKCEHGVRPSVTGRGGLSARSGGDLSSAWDRVGGGAGGGVTQTPGAAGRRSQDSSTIMLAERGFGGGGACAGGAVQAELSTCP